MHTLHSLFTILRPGGGSQAALADMDGFTLQRGRKLRDELLLHRGDRLSGGIVAGGGGDAVDTIGQRLDALLAREALAE